MNWWSQDPHSLQHEGLMIPRQAQYSAEKGPAIQQVLLPLQGSCPIRTPLVQPLEKHPSTLGVSRAQVWLVPLRTINCKLCRQHHVNCEIFVSQL